MIISFKIKGLECLIDSVDVDLLLQKWCTAEVQGGLTYVVSRTPRPHQRTLRLNRVIMARILGRVLERNELVDHINLNELDNRRENLRIATYGQNRANSRASKNNKLGVKGVRKVRGKFRADIRVNRKEKYLGTFDTPEQAHEAYMLAAKLYFGEFARGE